MTTNPLIDRAAFLAFVLEQPQDEHYQSGDTSNCAIARFLHERMDMPLATVYYGYVYRDRYKYDTHTGLDHELEAAVYDGEGNFNKFYNAWDFPEREHRPADSFTWGALATRLQAL
jgi:hypothetical protein